MRFEETDHMRFEETDHMRFEETCSLNGYKDATLGMIYWAVPFRNERRLANRVAEDLQDGSRRDCTTQLVAVSPLHLSRIANAHNDREVNQTEHVDRVTLQQFAMRLGVTVLVDRAVNNPAVARD
jgi:hypothetical protein